MAQLLAPAAPGSERISQILPTVKCSNCNQPVRIADLGEHVCAEVPPVPVMPALKTPSSPRSVAALLPTRLQNLVSAPAVQAPPRTSSVSSAPLRQQSPAPPPQSQPTRRPRAPSTASSLSVRSTQSRPDRVPSPLARDTRSPGNGAQVPFPSPAGPSEPSRVPSPRIPPVASRTPEVPAALGSRTSPGMDRSPTPGRSNIAAPGTTALRPRTPSSASVRPAGLHPNAVRQPVQSNPAPYSPTRPDPRMGPGAGPLMSPPAGIRERSGTNASVRPSFDNGPDVIYSTDPRARTPANDPVRMRAPSAASMRPSAEQQQQQQQQQQRAPYMAGAPPPARTPPPPVGTPHPEPDTQIGGTAGMAGVGRRGFAAAARAAMFTSYMGPAPPMPQAQPPAQDPRSITPIAPGGQGMDGRRANAPRFLDIASATQYAANTPPLSPGSGTASMSPHSPYSQKSPVSAGLPSPHSVKPSPNITPTTPAAPAIASSPTSPVSVHSLRDRVLPPSQEPPKTPLPDPPSTPRLPFFEKFKNKLPAVDTAKANPPPLASASADPSPLSPHSDDGSYGGLAYADSDEDHDDDDLPLRASPLPLATPAKPVASGSTTTTTTQNKVRFPSMTNSESKYSSSSSSTNSPRMPQRTLSSSTVGSSYTSRTVAKSTGALDRAMETLFEDNPLSPTTSTGSRPFASDAQRESVSHKSPKLPMRSHTSPTLPSSSSSRSDASKSGSGGAAKSKRPKTRICIRCERVIDDGRWIQMEGGNVLCDKCWKNMYLPKCRRCNKTIEKQAVSSSDGQLKGKYHKECFSCFTCEKPFPDKTFYVFDGKPYCAYHYHEENNSLCAAARCGQPIEGPCAVSHAGDRYHPEHLVCEYRGCTERLVEYYELDGRMLCERHVQKAMDERDDEDGDEDAFGLAGDRTTVALKRVTRFIDLAALGPVR
ncbi:hypothetical protein PYCCODRAFT_1441435 [Trametes coccinea BRFM310]|uniref:LIM zinc-binding domain-containing protein n=1 Tax=Trametes coccinea (strain BRFM310) TaxID=1353009 RepID=A0A1Y2J7Y5_TRAC3|nr:hypothetical protein PYCCODRAFT_1441435 [Trametes coccinea BRFM310]